MRTHLLKESRFNENALYDVPQEECPPCSRQDSITLLFQVMDGRKAALGQVHENRTKPFPYFSKKKTSPNTWSRPNVEGKRKRPKPKLGSGKFFFSISISQIILMWWLPWIASSFLLGSGLLFAYAIVLFDALGDFPLPSRHQNKSYFESPYWLGMHKSTATTIAVMQGFAAVGYVMWQTSLMNQRPTRGLFADPRWLAFANTFFLVPSILWPFAAYRLLQDESSVPWAVASSLCLWSAAAGMILLVAGTFEDLRDTPWATLGIYLTASVVVVADGVGWSAVALYNAIHSS